MARGSSDTTPAESVAIVVERLAALLAGGSSPASAWPRLARFESEGAAGAGAGARQFRMRRLPRQLTPEEVPARVARAARTGGEIAAELGRDGHRAWRALGAAWQLAEDSGAPLSTALRDLAAGFRDLGQSERDVEVELAGPIATARMVMALPLVGLVLSAALGFDTIGVLTRDPIGWVLSGVGVSLAAAGWSWNRRLIARASRRPETPGLALDLVAMGMQGGTGAEQVIDGVERRLRQFRLDASGLQRAKPILALASDAGVPASGLLRAEAALERRRARTAAAQDAARLGVQLMLPLGVCILPAFLAVGVAPLMVAVLRQAMP